MSIADIYEAERGRWSDIVDHLPTLVSLVEETDAQQVIELGVRHGTSTAAWLYALERTGGHLWSVDIADQTAGKFAGIDNWSLLIGDDMDLNVYNALPGEVDILFIDTSHEYIHTFNELVRYVNKVRHGGVIVLHDTAVEVFDHHVPGAQPPFPVRQAVDDWLDIADPQNLVKRESVEYCYGLTTLRMP
jgi:predicted O-methyltransferase YrrM